MIPDGEGPPPRGERRERNNYNDNEWESGERPQLKQQARAAKQQKPRAPRGMPNVNPGDVIQGRVQSIAPFGAFVEVRQAGWLAGRVLLVL
jgi:ribosomal protein S1